MAAGTVGYTDTRGNKDYTSIIASQIGNRLKQASNMASEERAYAAGQAEAGGTSLEEAGIGKGYFFGRALGSRFGGDRIARTRGRMGMGGAGTNPATNYKERFRGGFDYNVTNNTITDVAPLSNALVVGLRGVQEGLSDVAGAIQRQGTVLNKLSQNQADMAKATMFNGYLFAMFQSQQKQAQGRASLAREERSLEGGRDGGGRSIGGSSFGGAGGGRGMINVTPGGGSGGFGGNNNIGQGLFSAGTSLGLSRLSKGKTLGEKALGITKKGDVLKAAYASSAGLDAAKIGGNVAKLMGQGKLANLFSEIASVGTGSGVMKGVAGSMALQTANMSGKEAAKILGMGANSNQFDMFSEIFDANARSAARFDPSNPLFATANRDYDVFRSLRGPDGKPLFTGSQVDIFDQLGLSPGVANVEKYNRMMGKAGKRGMNITKLSRMRAAGGSIGNIAEDIAKYYPEVAFKNIDEAIVLTQFARLLDTKEFAGKPKKALNAVRNVFGAEIVDNIMVSGAQTAIKNSAVDAAFKQFAGKGGKGLLKGGALAGKRLPIIGAILGTAFAIDRARKGDFMGAGLEIASGLLGLTPITTGLGLGIDGFLLARDLGMTPMRDRGSITGGANLPFFVGGRGFTMNEKGSGDERIRVESDDKSRHVDAGIGLIDAMKKKKNDYVKIMGNAVYSGIGDAKNGGLFEGIGGGIEFMVDGFKEMFSGIKERFSNFKQSLTNTLSNIKDRAGNLLNKVNPFKKDEEGKNWFQRRGDGIKNWWNKNSPFAKDDDMAKKKGSSGIPKSVLEKFPDKDPNKPGDYTFLKRQVPKADSTSNDAMFQTAMYPPNVENSGINVIPGNTTGHTIITNNYYGGGSGGDGIDTGDANPLVSDLDLGYVAANMSLASKT